MYYISTNGTHHLSRSLNIGSALFGLRGMEGKVKWGNILLTQWDLLSNPSLQPPLYLSKELLFPRNSLPLRWWIFNFLGFDLVCSSVVRLNHVLPYYAPKVGSWSLYYAPKSGRLTILSNVTISLGINQTILTIIFDYLKLACATMMTSQAQDMLALNAYDLCIKKTSPLTYLCSAHTPKKLSPGNIRATFHSLQQRMNRPEQDPLNDAPS